MTPEQDELMRAAREDFATTQSQALAHTSALATEFERLIAIQGSEAAVRRMKANPDRTEQLLSTIRGDALHDDIA